MPYVERDESGRIIATYGAIQNPMFTESRAWISSGKPENRLDEYPHFIAEAARLGMSLDDAHEDLKQRWPEWVDDADLGEDLVGGGSGSQSAPVEDIGNSYEESYESLDDLKESLRLRVIAEAVRQSGLSANVLERVIELTKTLNDENTDEEARTSAQLELEQHNEYREKATLVEAAKQRKLGEIDAIETVEDALAYSVEDGWP